MGEYEICQKRIKAIFFKMEADQYRGSGNCFMILIGDLRPLKNIRGIYRVQF